MREADWQALLEANPTDAHTRLAYADWLEEEGDAVAGELQRWIAREDKKPFDWKTPSAPFDHSYDTVDWYDGSPAAWEVPGSCILPLPLWEALEPLRVDSTGSWAEFGSRAQAEAALLTAWRKLAEAGLPIDTLAERTPRERLRAELLRALGRHSERLRGALIETLTSEIPLEEGRRLQFEVDPGGYSVTLTATGAVLLHGGWLEDGLAESWFERADEDAIDSGDLIAEELCPWFAACWQEAGGPARYSPASLFFQGQHERRYDLEQRSWLTGQEAPGG